MREPAFNVHEDRLLIDIRLADGPLHRAPKRRIFIARAAVAAYLKVPAERIGDRQLESFGRANLDMICRRAIQLHEARSTFHGLPIDAPRGQGLPDIISINEGEL